MTPTPLLDIVDLHRHFGGNRAVNGVDLQVHHGETVGLVGESGSGKTTIGQTIVGMGSPTSGEIRYDGHDITGLSRGRRRELATSIQYIFQDPYGSLNPRMSVGEAIAEPLIAHGLATRASASDRVRDILEICGMSADSAERYPHEFSGGQRQRIVIARAMALEPDLVVADEPVSALDVSVQAQIINLFSDLREQRGTAFLFISHDLGVVWHLCDRVVILDKGVVVETGTRAQIFEDARHPYTRALLAAVPVPDPRARTRHAVERLLAEDNQRVPGQQAPVLVDIGDGHLVGYGG